MKPPVALKHAFVDSAPEVLEEGVIYVSIRHRTAMHKCCCGCGSEVVTPLGPTDWVLIFDGLSVSLDPSIGNWSLPCQSHYWIRNNKAYWAGAWSEEQVAAGRRRDSLVKHRYYEKAADPSPSAPARAPEPAPAPVRPGLLARVSDWLAAWGRGN
ncbi:DUF6527 family protein [Dongia sp.]|uniref:DUF6527 family protein n=1 Tax=Dongia sp. TaxID=1977262 RepID=UPI0035AF4C0C